MAAISSQSHIVAVCGGNFEALATPYTPCFIHNFRDFFAIYTHCSGKFLS